MKLTIIIPVYNEKKYFEKVIQKVLAVKLQVDKEIIIVESNSTDGTRNLVKKYDTYKQDKVKIVTLYEYRPKGKGHAVNNALFYATGDIILIQDCDLEYKIEEYPKLLQPIIDGKTKFVLGSRNLGLNTWMVRKYDHGMWYGILINIGSQALYTLFWILYGTKLSDPQTMFKLFKKECIKDIQFKSNYFDLDWEIVIKLVKKGYIPVEVPISYKGRTNDEGKKIKLWRDGPLALWTILKYRVIN